MKTKVSIFLVLFALLAFILNNLEEVKIFLNPDKGAFDELVMEVFKEKSFDSMSIMNSELEFRKTKDKELVDSVLNSLIDLKLKETTRDKIKYTGYEIRLSNNETFESFRIEICKNNFIIVRTDTMLKEEDKEKKIVRWKSVDDTKYYKIEEGSIDIDNLESIFLKLDAL